MRRLVAVVSPTAVGAGDVTWQAVRADVSTLGGPLYDVTLALARAPLHKNMYTYLKTLNIKSIIGAVKARLRFMLIQNLTRMR